MISFRFRRNHERGADMIPETAAYYRAMLLVGIRDKLDEAFDRALERWYTI